MNKNQIRLLYGCAAWFLGVLIYQIGSVPGGWGVLGDALGVSIGISLVTELPVFLILFFWLGKKTRGATADSDKPTIAAPDERAGARAPRLEDSQGAEFWYQKALSLGSDPKARLSCLEKSVAADPNHARSLYGIALHYISGEGGRRDTEAASRPLRRSADLGYPPAQDKLGLMYEYGEGFERDLRKAEALYRKAAEMKFAEAQYHLGVLYGNGEGLARDYIESTMWLRRAAEQDHPDAQATLGRIYTEGLDGVPKSTQEAAKWLRLAAENGDAESQLHLGLLLENGDGVEQDLEAAGRLYRQAADQGHEEGELGAKRIDIYLGRYTESAEPLPDEEDWEFRMRRMVESTRFKAPKKEN